MVSANQPPPYWWHPIERADAEPDAFQSLCERLHRLSRAAENYRRLGRSEAVPANK
jgi:hypothetical protein